MRPRACFPPLGMFTSLGILRYHEQGKHRHALRNLSFLTKPCAARLLPALNYRCSSIWHHRKDASGTPTGKAWKQETFCMPSGLWDVGYCLSPGRSQTLCGFPTVSVLRQNERNKHVNSFCIIFNPNVKPHQPEYKAQIPDWNPAPICGWYLARPERTVVPCDSKDIVRLYINSWLNCSIC